MNWLFSISPCPSKKGVAATSSSGDGSAPDETRRYQEEISKVVFHSSTALVATSLEL